METVADQSEIPKKPITFPPLFTNQIFREDETIHGYENLKIDIFFTDLSLEFYVDVSFTHKEPQNADDPLEMLRENVFTECNLSRTRIG